METFGILRTDNKRNEVDDLREALTSIADEIERFEVTENVSFIGVGSKITDGRKNLNDMNYKIKSKLKNKRRLVAKLRNDIKAACWVVKTLESVKRTETNALTSRLVYARGECVDLLKRYTNNIDIIENLHKHNTCLHDKLKSLAHFINLGYEELKKIQSEKIDEPTTLVQLKKLIESCGQYYANYRNEIEINLKIEQRNRFLKNKIVILENNIDAIKVQLKALEFRYLRLKAENNQIKAKSLEPRCLNFKVAYSEVKMKQSKEGYDARSSIDEKRFKESGDSFQEQAKNCDLSTHLEIVKRLLLDQDTLLKDLAIISKEISIV